LVLLDLVLHLDGLLVVVLVVFMHPQILEVLCKELVAVEY
jgi:hypothetical protein